MRRTVAKDIAARGRAGARPRRERALVRSHWARSSALAALALVIGIGCTLHARPLPVLLWNASASSTPGLSLVSSVTFLHPGDIAIAWPPPAARRLADARHYLPMGVPLVKRVAAVSGDRVCGTGPTVTVDGRLAAVRRARDPSGRVLPWWSGCRLLGPGELLLLSDMPDAFDGRYFGVTSPAQVIGRGRLLWAG
jgi:type IV secretory pathway protease TraF